MAWELLFKSDIGLLSLFTIVFIICMAIYLFFFVRGRIRQEEQHEQQLKLGQR
jgi:cbb3-type cytochrome oxidase subunit 3